METIDEPCASAVECSQDSSGSNNSGEPTLVESGKKCASGDFKYLSNGSESVTHCS